MLEAIREPWTRLPDGRQVDQWTFGGGGVSAQMLTLGATLRTLHVPDRRGRTANVVLSATDPAQLLLQARYFGATVGRYANRIAGGRLPVGGTEHKLSRNENERHTLHGGAKGFDNRLWESRAVREADRTGVEFRLRSAHDDQGFPGELDVTVSYTLDPGGALAIVYQALATAPTVVNLTNHAYFNLAGEGSGDVLDHLLQVEADYYSPVDKDLIPLPGPPTPVAATPFDFTAPRPLGQSIGADDPQLLLAAGGYDHNWLLRKGTTRIPRPAAQLWHPVSGRRLKCLTTEPGLQVYAGTHFDGSVRGPGGRPYLPFAGVALETQHFPDSPNRPDFPSTMLHPGQVYRSTTVYRFSAD